MRISDWSSDVCSSDLPVQERAVEARTPPQAAPSAPFQGADHQQDDSQHHHHGGVVRGIDGNPLRDQRSEEHTSELQSLMRISYAVFCLKKKNTQKRKNKHCTKITKKDKHKMITEKQYT